MVSLKHYLFLLSLLCLIGCRKNEFTLDFNLSPEVTENYDITYYATDVDGGKTVQTVASIRDGKCNLKGVTKRPTLCYITMHHSRLPLIIYAQRGEKIEITGEDKTPMHWEVAGNEINEELTVWRMKNLDRLVENNEDSINLAVRNYVEENPDNPVSALLLSNYFYRDKDEWEYADLMSILRGETKEHDWLKISGRSDQLVAYYSYPAKLKSMVMRSEKGGTDTLIIDKKNPVLLMFWQPGNSVRKNLIDSIKAIDKEFKDSVKLIADICLDVDSTGWRNAIRKDSLDNIKRFWAPAGINDPVVEKLQVKAIPYFIVMNREGEQIYRGRTISEALKEYRRLMLDKDSL